MQIMVQTISHRIVSSLTTFPVGVSGWAKVGGITLATTTVAGITAYTTGFIHDPYQDYCPPSTLSKCCYKSCSAILFPSLVEELLWRAALIPMHPYDPKVTIPTAIIVLAVHVLSHPIAAYTCWPRGKEIFNDYKFLCLATIVLGGATLSYVVSGGSVWAAAITHGIPVTLWRDYFNGEAKLAKLIIKGSERGERGSEETTTISNDDTTTTSTNDEADGQEKPSR